MKPSALAATPFEQFMKAHVLPLFCGGIVPTVNQPNAQLASHQDSCNVAVTLAAMGSGSTALPQSWCAAVASRQKLASAVIVVVIAIVIELVIFIVVATACRSSSCHRIIRIVVIVRDQHRCNRNRYQHMHSHRQRSRPIFSCIRF